MPRKKKAEVDLTAVLSGLSKTLERIEKKLDFVSPTERVTEPNTTLAQATTDTVEDLAERAKKGPEQSQARTLEINPQTYCPPEFRETIDEVLNRDFGIEVAYDDSVVEPGNFLLTITVPKKYQNLSEEHLRVNGGVQKHIKAVQNAMGSAGVREYAEKVFNHFSNETRSLIVADRVQFAV